MIDDKIYSFDFYESLKEGLLLNFTDCKAISFINPFSYYMLSDNKEISGGIDGFFIDGALLCYLHNATKKNKVKRISFDYSSISGDFLDFCNEKKLRVSFIGATDLELKVAMEKFSVKYPDINYGYSRDGYVKKCDERILFDGVDGSDVVIVGMGAPYQEEWALKIKKNCNVKLIITCGGFLTQTSIRDDYYYPIIKTLGLRWLQRMACHKHVRDKVFKMYPAFLRRYVSEFLSHRF